MVVPAAVLAEHEVAPGRHRQVVAVLHQVAVVGLDEQLQGPRRFRFFGRPLAGARFVAPHLSLLLLAAAGACKVDGLPAVPHALAAGESGGALVESLVAQVIVRGLHVLHVHPGRGHAVPGSDGLRLVVGRVQARPDEGHERLQPAACREISGLVGQVAVDETVAGVLGLIDDARCRMDGHGLVVEAAHRLQGDRLHRPRGRTGRDLEVVPVVLFVILVGALGRFLAGDPASPGGEAAGAVAHGAGEAEVMLLQFTGGAEYEGRRPTLWWIAAAPVVEPLARQLAETLVLIAEGADLAGPRREFVVADQQGPSVRAGKGGHRVGQSRHPQAIVHLDAGAGDHPVGEARGQVDDPARVRSHGAVTRGDPLIAGFPPDHVVLQPMESQGDGGRRLQELPSGDWHLPLRFGQYVNAVDDCRDGPGHLLEQLGAIVKQDCRACIAISHRILCQPRQPFAGGRVVFGGMPPHGRGQVRQIVCIAVVCVERGNPALQRVFECLLRAKADGFLRSVRLYQNLQNAEFPLGIRDALPYIGPVARLRVVVIYLVSIGVETVADCLAGHVVARAAPVMEIHLTHFDEVDADGAAVQRSGLSVSDRTGALIRAIVPGTGVGNDEQVDVRIRAEVPPGARAEQDHPVWMYFIANSARHGAGFRVGGQRCR